MLQQERFDIILSKLKKKSTVRVSELSAMLGVSDSTIRRDINDLAEAGRVKKIFGGATLNGLLTSVQEIREPDVASKHTLHIEEKNIIAKYAASLIQKDDFVFLDAGTTTELMIEYLNHEACYVTNGITNALKLSSFGYRCYLISGQPKVSTESLIGSTAVNSLRQYDFSKAFLGTNGIDVERGFTTPDIEEAVVKTEAIHRAAESFVLADASKFGIVTPVSFAPIDAAKIITTDTIDEEYTKYSSIIKASED